LTEGSLAGNIHASLNLPEVYLEDQFGSDPQVRYLRRIFAGMERKQSELLERIGVVPTDYRLKRIREAALKHFEKAWMLAGRRGIVETEDEIGDLYVHCLAKVLSGNRINVPGEFLSSNTKISDVVKEVSR
jgi:hypothetical protein